MGYGIDNRRYVHPQGHTEGHKHIEVTIFGGDGGNDKSAAGAEKGNVEQQKRQQQNEGIGMNIGAREHIYDNKHEEHCELHKKIDGIEDDVGSGHYKARKINLAEYSSIAEKG